MLRNRAGALLALLLVGCSTPPSSLFKSAPSDSVLPASARGPAVAELPVVANGSSTRIEGAVVTLEGDRVLVDDASPGSTEDALVARLSKKVDTWKAVHPEAPPILVLRLARTATAAVARRLVASAARAGYPRVAIAVSVAGKEAHLDIDSDQAAWPTTEEPEMWLHVFVDGSTRVALSWRKGNIIVSTLDIPPQEAFQQGGLPATLQREWATAGAHRDPQDRRVDHALVSVTPDIELGALASTIDALVGTKREFAGQPGPAPVFAVALEEPLGPTLGLGWAPKPASGASVRQGEVVVKGSLPSEVVQRLVRPSFGRLRLCYEDGLVRDQRLAGEVVVGFTIRKDGSVGGVTEKSATLPDADVRRCVLRVFGVLSFPAPQTGTVQVTFPLSFAPAPAP